MGITQRKLIIQTNQKGVELGDLFGIFFEDLNHAADGGLYAELVQNRSFEFDPVDNPSYHALTAWEKVERRSAGIELTVEDKQPLNPNNKHYLVLDVKEPGDGAGIKNLGFHPGIPINQGDHYLFSCYARSDTEAPVIVTLESADGQVHAHKQIQITSSEWSKYEVILTPSGTDYSACLILTCGSKCKLYLDMVSLFPEKTFKGRRNGLREDIAQLLADMKPKFMRFPGGCLVHDGSLDADARDSMYRWKNTIGDITQRPSRRNNWHYNQTLGLGYYEYFQFCDDIGAKAIPVLPAGYNPHNQAAVSIDELQPWIDDALDLIEFANGGVSTAWGKIRAELGHPEPFCLEYIAIGNEETGEAFFERYDYFHNAIRAKYPGIKIINTGGPFSGGVEYERGWKSAREMGSDFVDEHYYTSPEWLLANYHRYDNYDPKGPKAFIGEYATWGNTFYNALAEAAYMTGLERNARVVGLACYAPLLCNIGYQNWRTNLIWFNNRQVYGTPNYYVQKLFMHNQGDRLLGVRTEGLDAPSQAEKSEPISGRISFTGNDTAAEFYDILLRNNETGKERAYHDIQVGDNDKSVVLDCEELTGFILCLKAKRSKGNKGFIIRFGMKDEDDCIEWRIGGWGNDGVLMHAVINGRGTCLTSRRMVVETGREYSLCLEVFDRHIRAYVDGELVNETEDRLPVIKPLYYSASEEDSTGDVICKVVNVQNAPITAQVVLEGTGNSGLEGNIFEFSGFDLANKS